MVLHSHSSKVRLSTFTFFAHCTLYALTAFLMIFWLVSQLMLFCFLYDGSLLSSFLSFLFPTVLRLPVITCPTGSYLKPDTWQSQLRFVVPNSKSRSLILCLKLKILPACYSFCMGVANKRRCLILKEAGDSFCH